MGILEGFLGGEAEASEVISDLRRVMCDFAFMQVASDCLDKKRALEDMHSLDFICERLETLQQEGG